MAGGNGGRKFARVGSEIDRLERSVLKRREKRSQAKKASPLMHLAGLEILCREDTSYDFVDYKGEKKSAIRKRGDAETQRACQVFKEGGWEWELGKARGEAHLLEERKKTGRLSTPSGGNCGEEKKKQGKGRNKLIGKGMPEDLLHDECQAT